MEKTDELENKEINQDNLMELMKKIDDTSANLNLMISYFSMLDYAMELSDDEPLKEKAVSLYLTFIKDNVLNNLQYVTENAVDSLKATNNGLSYMLDSLDDTKE